MKMAKASKDDIQALQNFFNNLENAIEEDKSDEVIAKYVRQCLRGRVGSAHNRVTIGCDILIDNVCDPDKSYLAYKPEILKYCPETVNENGECLYYILSYKHSRKGILSFWRANNAGYTTNLKWAGKYTETEVLSDLRYYHNGEGSVAVSVAEFHDGRYTICHRVDLNHDEKAKHVERCKLGILVDSEKEVASE